MFSSIKDITQQCGITFSKSYDNYTTIILDIFNDGGVDHDENPYILNIMGLYHSHITQDYVLMKKYYLMAIEQGHVGAMNNLGHYYSYIERDYVLMKKYYLMAIEQGDAKAMYNLGHYYEHIEKDDDEMKKYYLMAIDQRNEEAMYNLGSYYKHVEKDYDEMKKYYLMAIDQGQRYGHDRDRVGLMNDLGYRKRLRLNEKISYHGD